MSTLTNRLRAMNEGDLAFLESERAWSEAARADQVLPIDGWSMAIAQPGRGWGKTMSGSAWVRRCAGIYPGCIIHVIAPTYSDLRGVVFGGASGLLASIPRVLIKEINHSLFELRFWNGTLIRGFSAEAPDRLRGPQCTFVWGDELAAWPNAEETLTNIDMSTRLVFRTLDNKLVQPQRYYTTTPRPLSWLKKMVERADRVIHGSTYDNKANLAAGFLRDLQQYEGTQIGRQEIHGELLDIGEQAIIKRSWLKLWPAKKDLPWFEYIMVSLDTALTEATFSKKNYEADPTACTVWGVFLHEKRWCVMLLECWHDQIGFPELVMRAKRDMAAIYGRRRDVLFKPVVGSQHEFEQVKRPDLLIIEDKGSGISLRQTLAYEGIDSYPYNPGKADKLSRLHAVSHVAASGRIYLIESLKNPDEPRDWVQPFIDEVCVYSGPGTTPHDDFVDSFSQAMRFYADRWLNAGVGEVVKRGEIEVTPQVLVEDMPRNEYQQPMENPYG